MNGEERARDALARGDLAGATLAANALVEAAPQAGAGYFLQGLVAAEAGQIARAVPLLEAAVEREPCAEYLAQLARLLILLRREGEAGVAARRALALALAPGDALTCDTIGCVLTRLGDHEAALVPFGQAVEAEPDNLEFRYNLAAACGFTGKVDEARANYEAILAADPGHARAHYALAILSRQSPSANHVPRLKAALGASRRPDDALRIRYALAKELEDMGEAREAFGYLSDANAAHKQAIGYDFGHDEAIFDALRDLFEGGAEDLVRAPGNPDAAPIFVVGMPRTGTTLVDRILSSHPEVASAGELQAMPLAVKQATGTPSRRVIDAPTVRASGAIDPALIGEAYLARAAHQRPKDSPRFVDKLPANFLYVGHIARSLPNARIVCLRRHPMDTVWSNFKNLFASQSAYYAYSYDLMDCARYYRAFDRLMDLWERVFPGRVLQLGYETLVADQEGQTRALLAHCALDWDPACLAFHENRASVATPSAAQVRRKLNADAVGRWKTHAEGLAEVAAYFRAEGIAID
ncbi:sulfotransferase [Novosphingobium profundi]|uniref:tetratricopeptide repeat-containing sulfotransferase family protein n=1 Tax=Novosphingobium profundi TaxID=1774954 RepID=UPI001BD9BFDB|nr:sulfotransferase [Novosphingobium profundi]MBT0667578.1 sulfotransferase [Novosphingobium profundi]